ncbi:AAA family ATPase [Propioniferax innocua]|uniref:MoxR-like ATPase n=1 Tax=Propioniferax innocua TaxID=1753 RepID=A0A542ZDJ0_9ACTN|nr:MoxR family ATPase [Propioniferax innocua]TQL58349.1 MoxR-like ATPase [Propioniferax innocua]
MTKPTNSPAMNSQAMNPPSRAARGDEGPGGSDTTRDASRAAAWDALQAVRGEVAKAVVGQERAVDALLIGLLARGHVLLEGVPGTAKTLLVRSLAKALSVETRRIQFTADMMPGDVTGSLVYDSQTSEFEFRPGPVFSNLVLADEINRTPPKTQAALLEAMEERQVTTDGVTRALPDPFLVAATQNPIEFEGTYPLPEAQLDRFLLKADVDLPPRDAEIAIVERHAHGFNPHDLDAAGLQGVASAEDLRVAADSVARVQLGREVAAYLVDLARATRHAPSVLAGVSPRATTALLRAAKARAWLTGREFITPDDVKELAPMAWAHRIALRPEAELEGVGVQQVLGAALESVLVPR